MVAVALFSETVDDNTHTHTHAVALFSETVDDNTHTHTRYDLRY